MSTGQVTQADDVSPQIVALMPIIRREAFAFIKNLPAHFELNALIQQGRLAAWEAIQKFDGRGTLEGYAVLVIRNRFIDFQRTHHPAGRNGNNIVFESLDDERDDGSACDDLLADAHHDNARCDGEQNFGHADPTADAVIDKLTYEHAMAGMDPRRRAVVERVIAGEAKEDIAASLGVSASRVSQLLSEAATGKRRNKTPDTFDPASVPLRMGVPIPPPAGKVRRNRFKELADATPAGGSRVLGIVQARSFISQLKKMKIRHIFRISESGTTAEVWREPTAEQLRGAQEPGAGRNGSITK